MNKKCLKSFVFALIFGASMQIMSQSSGNQISIQLSHAPASKYLAIYVTDEVTKSSVYNESYKATAQINGTDAGGNFIRIVSGLNQAHTYSVSILIDVDNQGSVNNVDLGKTITGISPGSTVIIDALNPLSQLENISLTAAADARFTNKKAACTISESSFSYPQIITSGMLFGQSGISVLFFDSVGNASWNNLWLPAGNHGNMLCVLDNNTNKIMDSGDYFAIGAQNGSNVNYILGDWFVLP